MRVGRGGRTESSAPTKRDVEDAVPYTLRHCEEYPKGTCFAARSDAAIRSPRHKETDFRAGDMGGQSRSTLQRDGFPRQSVPQGHLLRGAHWLGMTGNGTSYPKGTCSAALHCRTPCPTERSLRRYFSKKQDLPGQVLFCFAITRSRRAAERSDGRA